MQHAYHMVSAFVILAPLCGCSAVASSPLSAVVGLLKELSAKVEREKELAAKAFGEYTEWCDDTTTEKGFEIESSTSQKGKLEAKIIQMTSSVEVSNTKISDLAAEIASKTAMVTNATGIREQEASDFAAGEKELVEVIDTLDRASGILQREMQKSPGSFAQFQSARALDMLHSLNVIADAAALSGAQKQQLAAFLQSSHGEEEEEDELSAPAAAVYKSQSGSILDLLEDLREKAEGQLADLRKAESENRHNFDMLKQSLEDEMDADTKDLAEAKSTKASASEAKAIAEGDLEHTLKDLASAEETLAATKASCEETSKNHEASTKAREEELKVIAEATQILEESTSGAADQSYSFVQTKTVSKLRTRADLVKSEVVAMVQRLAQKHHSSALAQLASRIGAVVHLGTRTGEDPFVKVKGLIQELIEKLESEASAEATEKAFCDKEMEKTSSKKEELNGDIERLTTKIDQAASRSTSLKAAVKELQQELAALAATQAKMDKIRGEEHEDYLRAKADLETGLSGVQKALTVLREYFAEKDEKAEEVFLQAHDEQPEAPKQFTKAGGAGSSIIAILEQVESDFARNLATTEADESSAAEDYAKLTQDNKVVAATKEQDVKYKTREASSLDKEITELSADRESLNAELAAVLEYDTKIKERCVAKPETYEERKARREAEIAGLKDALAALDTETALLQRGHSATPRLRGLLAPGA